MKYTQTIARKLPNRITAEQLQGVVETMKAVDDVRPFYGDKEKEYICLVPDSFSHEVFDMLRSYKNVTVKPIDPEYLPEKDSICFVVDAPMGAYKLLLELT